MPSNRESSDAQLILSMPGNKNYVQDNCSLFYTRYPHCSIFLYLGNLARVITHVIK